MATAKLTLSLDKRLIREAKKQAAARGISVSHMSSKYVEAHARVSTTEPEVVGPLTREATGLVRMPDDERPLRDLLATPYPRNIGSSDEGLSRCYCAFRCSLPTRAEFSAI